MENGKWTMINSKSQTSHVKPLGDCTSHYIFHLSSSIFHLSFSLIDKLGIRDRLIGNQQDAAGSKLLDQDFRVLQGGARLDVKGRAHLVLDDLIERPLPVGRLPYDCCDFVQGKQRGVPGRNDHYLA